MTITLAVDEQMLKRAREVAEGLGTTVNSLIRRYLEELTCSIAVEEELQELERLSAAAKGDPRGWRFDRDAAHERS